MKCPKCGKTIRNDSSYCYVCGANVAEGGTGTKLLVCKSCGGQLDISENEEYVYCPFCGSKNLIIESDTVKIEKNRNKTRREIEKDKNDADVKKAIIKAKAESSSGRRWLIAAGLYTVVIIVMIVVFSWRDVNVAKKVADGEIVISTCTSNELSGMQYDEALKLLQNDGFTNIVSVKIKTGLFSGSKVGQVKSVTINDELITTDTPYSPDVKVKLTYYSND